MKIVIQCPAKINSFLSVGPPGAGGYHSIRTLLHAVAVFDTLIVESASTTEVTSDWSDLPPENTLTRALALLQEVVKVPPISVHLEKRIPVQSGLGGGSSDAAGLLRAVCRLTGVPVDQHIVDIASSVGKDVPFFLIGGTARGEGFGDRVSPLEDLPTVYVLLAKPEEGIASGPAYAALDSTVREWREFPEKPWVQYNDFERVAPCVCGELTERMRIHGADIAGLSGSGSSVYGIFRTEAGAVIAQTKISAEFSGLWTSIAPTLTRAESLNMEVTL